ncbi:DSBA-like thioredoxin domain protein [gamma proteobacterium HdN1]|nr:DSBA-like thioredoxin domain protein [gamma proteobacterium HdN1]
MSLKQPTSRPMPRDVTSNRARHLRRAWFDVTRYLRPSRNVVTFFHKVDDPYSWLLLQALPRLLKDFRVQLSVQFVLDIPPDGVVDVAAKQAYTLIDAARLADFHQLSFPDHPQQPSAQDAFAASAILIKHQNSPKLLHLMLEVTGALWKDSSTTFESCIKRYGLASDKDTRSALSSSRENLYKLGHFQAGSLFYGNEWYCGLDRLGHLAERLDRPSLRQHASGNPSEIADYQRQYRHVLQSYNTLRPRPRQLKPMEFFFSFQCPYSYLAIGRLVKLQELYQFPLTLRLVYLDQQIASTSPQKRLYALYDANREAKRFNIPFQRQSEPADEGIHYCMALLPWAQAQGKEREYILSIMNGIWAESIDTSEKLALKKLVERAGLNWESASKELENERWKTTSNLNRKALHQAGGFGVPTFCYGELVAWGQDRLWAIEQAMLRSDRR